MRLLSLSLTNFRSYSQKHFEFSGQTALIIGPNTAGKTNLLEAIYLLATGKSFRAEQEKEMINWQEEISNLKSQISNLNDQVQLEILLTVGEIQGRKTPIKKYLVNGVARRQLDFVGNFRAVLFWPEDLELVTDSPSLRRKYLDNVLTQVDREYRRNLYSYERGLRQRNKLLDLIQEEKAHRHQLNFWNQLLIRSGGYLTEKRAEYLEFVNIHSRYQIRYDKSVISESRLEQYKDEELNAGATLVGPHRDDFMLNKNDRELSKYGSRGEQRLAVLWLKLAELEFVETKTGEKPILLLDDIFSELDEEHRKLVFKIIAKQQTILTAIDTASLPKKIIRETQIIKL